MMAIVIPIVEFEPKGSAVVRVPNILLIEVEKFAREKYEDGAGRMRLQDKIALYCIALRKYRQEASKDMATADSYLKEIAGGHHERKPKV